MSHFNLAIFTLDENPNLDEIMEPFFEGNRVEPYIDMTKSELIEDARRQMQCIFETRYPAALVRKARPHSNEG